MKAQKFTYFKIVNIHGIQPLFRCICVWGCGGGCKIFPGSVSVRYCVPNLASKECFLEVTNFGFCSTLLFHMSCVINCLKRKYSWFIEYAQCTSQCPDTCVNVHHWLARNDFKSSDHCSTDWWIRIYLFIGIKEVVCFRSKKFGGKDVTSCVFLSLILV
jgi:hypothetical protein